MGRCFVTAVTAVVGKSMTVEFVSDSNPYRITVGASQADFIWCFSLPVGRHSLRMCGLRWGPAPVVAGLHWYRRRRPGLAFIDTLHSSAGTGLITGKLSDVTSIYRFDEVTKRGNCWWNH